jgi:hypothetical protein
MSLYQLDIFSVLDRRTYRRGSPEKSLFLNNSLEEPDQNFIYRLLRTVSPKPSSSSVATSSYVSRSHCPQDSAARQIEIGNVISFLRMPAEPMNRWAEETCTSSYVGRYDYHPKESPMTDSCDGHDIGGLVNRKVGIRAATRILSAVCGVPESHSRASASPTSLE